MRRDIIDGRCIKSVICVSHLVEPEKCFDVPNPYYISRNALPMNSNVTVQLIDLRKISQQYILFSNESINVLPVFGCNFRKRNLCDVYFLRGYDGVTARNGESIMTAVE